MGRNLAPEKRLVVAADYDPNEQENGERIGTKGVLKRVIALATALEGLGCIIKVNSILRAVGYMLINELHKLGLAVFADLKLVDIKTTLQYDGRLLAECKPELVTVMANAGVEGMRALKDELSGTEILGVTVLTTFDDDTCRAVYGCTSAEGVLRFARLSQKAELQSLILSPKEIDIVRGDEAITLGLNTPGIRPEWAPVKDDDQKRVTTIKQAIQLGADRVVLGRPITLAKDPREAAKQTIEEIRSVLGSTN